MVLPEREEAGSVSSYGQSPIAMEDSFSILPEPNYKEPIIIRR
jgi:hypothetical protein